MAETAERECWVNDFESCVWMNWKNWELFREYSNEYM
jgi:hypothetical protein